MRDKFRAAGIDTPELDARRLAEAAFGFGRADLTLREAEPAPPALLERLQSYAARRLAGEPVARILGVQEFYGLSFELNAATLVPRPETELLVDLAIQELSQIPNPRLLDLGTGTGAIAVAVLANLRRAKAVAVDLSPDAIEAARKNAERNGVGESLDLRQGSWFKPLGQEERFDAILSNPPYIESAAIDTLQREVRHFDPRLALDGGPDGLEPYRVIAASARQWLTPEGVLMVEIGSTQSGAVEEILGAAGFASLRTQKDIAGLDRVVIAHHFT